MTETQVALLPSTADAPRLPPWLVMPEEAEEEGNLILSPWKVDGLTLDALSVMDLLIALPAGSAGGRQWGADLHYWGLVAKLGLELLAQHKFLPGLVEEEGQYQAAWLPAPDDLNDRARLRALAQASRRFSRPSRCPCFLPGAVT